MELLGPDDLTRAVESLDWQLDGAELTKVVRRRDFGDALSYVNAVGALAEGANHHPDIDIRWDTVTLRLSTHSRGGITDADISLAAAIDDMS
jgi:4a-hydroxytetrahydrobiopterin dehydratase